MPVKVYCRFVASKEIADELNDVVTISSTGVENTSVKLLAKVVPTVPSIFASTEKVKFGYQMYDASNTKQISISGGYLEPESGTISLSTKTNNYTIALNDDNYGNSAEFTYNQAEFSSTSISIQFKPIGTEHLKNFVDTLTISGGNAITKIVLTGTGITSRDGLASHYYIFSFGKRCNR